MAIPLVAGTDGRRVMKLVYALLDFVDAVSAAIGLVVLWYTWVVPPRNEVPPPSPSDPEEVERFVRTATLNKPPATA
jgi:hypothetical protein